MACRNPRYSHNVKVLDVATDPEDDALCCTGTVEMRGARGAVAVAVFPANSVPALQAPTTRRWRRPLTSRSLFGYIVSQIAEVRLGHTPDNQLDIVPMLSLLRRWRQSSAR